MEGSHGTLLNFKRVRGMKEVGSFGKFTMVVGCSFQWRLLVRRLTFHFTLGEEEDRTVVVVSNESN
jgi:hypothetical protein